MKKFLAFVSLLLLITGGLTAQAAYDGAQVKQAMHTYFAAAKDAKAALDAKNSAAAVQAFNTLASASQPLLAMNPPKGSKADWDAEVNKLIAAAKKGSDAAAQGDWSSVKTILGDIQKIQGEGHREFR